MNRVESILALTGAYPRGRVAEVACGNGTIGVAVREQGHLVDQTDITDRRVKDEARPFFKKKSALDIDYAPYDLILCCGLWYHISVHDQLKLAKLFVGKPVVLDTQYSIRARTIQEDIIGEFRSPTTSSFVKRPFVPTVEGLQDQFTSHAVCQMLNISWPPRERDEADHHVGSGNNPRGTFWLVPR